MNKADIQRAFERVYGMVEGQDSVPLAARRTTSGDDIGRELDEKAAEDLALAILSRWLVAAKALPGDTIEEFTRINVENRLQAEGAIVAIVKLLGDIGAGRPSFPTKDRT